MQQYTNYIFKLDNYLYMKDKPKKRYKKIGKIWDNSK